MNDTQNNKKWYVVYVGDQKRIQALPAVLKAISPNSTIWAPTQTVYYKVENKVKEVVKPVFPGYVFINTDVEANNIEDAIKTACGGKFLRNPGNIMPTSLSDEEIKHLKKVASEKNTVHSVTDQYDLTVDQEVEIRDGSFKGTRGIIKELRKEKVIVEVNIFGRYIMAEVDPSLCLIIKK